MITLRRGNRLPTVGVFQSFLQRQDYPDERISVDGIFGRETFRAVQAAQRRLGFAPTGVVNYDLWRRIVGRDRKIIDSVDLTDIEIEDDRDLIPYGQTVIRNYGQCKGVFDNWDDILRRAHMGQTVLLRFHGHGSPGVMITSSGVYSNHGSDLNHLYGASFDAFLARLRPIFSPFGSVEMHGCRVGFGNRGATLLRRMADAIQVPVTAALHSQYGGGSSTFRFEGPTRTVCPNGMDLKTWTQSRYRSSYF